MLEAPARVEVQREEKQREWQEDVKECGEAEALHRLR